MAAEYSVFDRWYGTRQGRCAPTGFTPTDDNAVVHGDDLESAAGYVRVGDFVSWHQTKDIGTDKILRLRMRTRGPLEAPPVTIQWVASVYIDGVEVPGTRRVCTSGETRDYVDVAVNLAGLAPGDHGIALVLKLEEI